MDVLWARESNNTERGFRALLYRPAPNFILRKHQSQQSYSNFPNPYPTATYLPKHLTGLHRLSRGPLANSIFSVSIYNRGSYVPEKTPGLLRIGLAIRPCRKPLVIASQNTELTQECSNYWPCYFPSANPIVTKSRDVRNPPSFRTPCCSNRCDFVPQYSSHNDHV